MVSESLVCERGVQLLHHADSELQPGSNVTLRTRGVQLGGVAPDIHRLRGSPSALSAAAASWGLLRVAASELTVSFACLGASVCKHRLCTDFDLHGAVQAYD